MYQDQKVKGRESGGVKAYGLKRKSQVAQRQSIKLKIYWLRFNSLLEHSYPPPIDQCRILSALPPLSPATQQPSNNESPLPILSPPPRGGGRGGKPRGFNGERRVRSRGGGEGFGLGNGEKIGDIKV